MDGLKNVLYAFDTAAVVAGSAAAEPDPLAGVLDAAVVAGAVPVPVFGGVLLAAPPLEVHATSTAEARTDRVSAAGRRTFTITFYPIDATADELLENKVADRIYASLACKHCPIARARERMPTEGGGPMSTKQFLSAGAATRSSGFVRVAPPAAHVLGSESAYVTLGNPMFGTDITIVSRVRDAKQAAPPRGEVH